LNHHDFRDILQQHLPLNLSAEQQAALFAHFELFERWNTRMNLTAIDNPEEAVVRHYCESVFFAMNIPEERAEISIADIGSGAGFPGVPIAIVRPLWSIALVESNQRKAVFLRESTRHIRNVSIEAKRAESLASSYHWLVSRAVKHSEVLALVPSISRLVGLLSTQQIFDRCVTDLRFTWNNPIAIPWDPRRLCLYGRST